MTRHYDLRPWPGEPESLVVTIDTGERIHYLDWGGCAGAASGASSVTGAGRLPPLLLLHGLSQTAWSWTPIARRLCAVTRVLAMDLRGHGLSDAPRTGYGLESQAFDALTVLVANGYGIDAGGPPAVLAGHGLGALIAVTAAAVQPGSSCGVALVDAGWEDLEAATGMTAAEFERGLGDPPEKLRSMADFLADRRDFDPQTWDADQERAARATVDEKHAGHVAPVAGRHAVRGSVEAMFDYRPSETLAVLDHPLLICVAASATSDDEAARDRDLALDELIRSRAEARLSVPAVERFTGAGHSLMRYRPDELAGAIGGLLERAAAYQRS